MFGRVAAKFQRDTRDQATANAQYRVQINQIVRAQAIPAVQNTRLRQVMKNANAYARRHKLPPQWTNALKRHAETARAGKLNADRAGARSRLPQLRERLLANTTRARSQRLRNNALHAIPTRHLLARAPSPPRTRVYA